MRCDVCHRRASNHLPFNCELCAQLAAYKPRIDLANSLLKNERLENEVEQQFVGVSKSKSTATGLKSKDANLVGQLEKNNAEQILSRSTVEDITAQIKALKGDIQHMKLDVAKRRARLVRRRKDQASAREELLQGQTHGKTPFKEDLNKISEEWELLHQRTAQQRLTHCTRTARLLNLQQHKQRQGHRPLDLYSIGFMPIPDLRELNSAALVFHFLVAALTYPKVLIPSMSQHRFFTLPA